MRPPRPAAIAVAVAALLTAATVAAGARSDGAGTTADHPAPPPGSLPAGTPELPVLHAELHRGEPETGAAPAATPMGRTVDGRTDDWQGTATGFGGTSVLSAGELVYQDHLFDAHGADDGRDAERLGLLDPLAAAVPETYRLDPIFQADLAGEVGLPAPEATKAEEHYGDAGPVDHADLLELRIGTSASTVDVLARTTTLTDAGSTAVLVLVDRVPGSPAYDIPFNAGIRTDTADVAILLAAGAGTAVDLATGVATPVPVAVDPSGWTNAIEASVPRELVAPDHPGRGRGKALGRPERIRVAAATGSFDAATGGFLDLPGEGANLANAAFRHEPVRTWFDKHQALALWAGTLDPFATEVDLRRLDAGASERFTPGAGYHDRIFTSSEAISREGGQDGIHQHYGVYIPSAYASGDPVPATFWLHWRGGKAHSAATVSPRIMRDQGENRGGIVLAPRGRGTSTWYLGHGMVDVLEVWDDAMSRFAIDPERVYVSGHSMGGWGSYLLTILMPDRFAAALPVAGPVTQGAWTGLDVPGCDDFTWDGTYTPCYIETNNGDARTQHTRPLLDNLRHVPLAIFQGGADELVPTSGVTRQVERLVELGYRHRYYLFPTYEHYSHPVVDEWAEGVRYLDQFRRPANPAHVTYVRSLPFEDRVRKGADNRPDRPVQAPWLVFDRAYWMSELTPADPGGTARFDGRALARAGAPHLLQPEAGGPASVGQVGPYTMTGLAWLPDPLAAAAVPANRFEATLAGAAAVRLDTGRMGLDVTGPITATVTTDRPLELRLSGPWAAPPAVTTAEGAPLAATLDGDVLRIALPAAATTFTVTP